MAALQYQLCNSSFIQFNGHIVLRHHTNCSFESLPSPPPPPPPSLTTTTIPTHLRNRFLLRHYVVVPVGYQSVPVSEVFSRFDVLM